MGPRIESVECAKHAYRYIGRSFWPMTEWAAPYLLTWFFADILFRATPFHTDSMVRLLLVGAGLVPLWVPVTIRIQREIVLGTSIEGSYFSHFAGKRFVSCLLVSIATSILAFFPSFFTSFSIEFLTRVSLHWIFVLIAALVAFGLVVLSYIVILRISVAMPLAAVDRKDPIRTSWKFTRGKLLRIFGAVMLVAVPFLIANQILEKLFGGLDSRLEPGIQYYAGISAPILFHILINFALSLGAIDLSATILRILLANEAEDSAIAGALHSNV